LGSWKMLNGGLRMIREICKLHSQLDFDKELRIKFSRYEYETVINKSDILKIEGKDDNVLKVLRPDGQIRLINVDQIIVVYLGRRSLI
jgi:hypothetical protein